MMDRSVPIFGTRRRVALSTTFGLLIAPTAITLTVSRPAYADVVGRLRLVVTDQANKKPVGQATVTLRDLTGVRPDVILTTEADGTVLSPPLENHVWHIIVSSVRFQTDERDVTVAADVTTEVEVPLGPVQTGTTTVRLRQNLVRTDKTANSIARSQSFFQKYPISGGNDQSLSKALRANPGFVEDSVNQAHPRGEHAETSVYINGFLLPGALQGRAGQFLSPSTIQTLDVQTGGYAPEYGGETAAVMNLSLRSGTIDPFTDLKMGGGGWGTFQANLTVGGQAGGGSGGSDVHGGQREKIWLSGQCDPVHHQQCPRSPQPNKQNVHNSQTSTTGFGNFSYQASDNDTFSLLLNTAPARTEIANRTGLPDSYRGKGQGFGYGGAQDAGSMTMDAAGNTIPLLSQQASGQDIYQEDRNSFSALQYRKIFSDTVNGFFTVGYSNNQQNIKNHNPNNETLVNPSQLAADSSIEFSPTIKRDYKQAEVQGNLTVAASPAHTIKLGAQYIDQKGDESYLLIPGSQLALNALAATDARLAPQGGVIQTDDSGNPVTDANGNPVYRLSVSSATPTLGVKRKGYYAAGFIQDTWKLTRKFTANYGLRVDSYKQSQEAGAGAAQPEVKETELSPRINTAYVVAPLTVVRLSYNKLFSQPPLAQGAIIGEPIRPQHSDLWEQSIEKQFGQTQSAKLAFYQKSNRRQIDTGLLLPSTQIGVFTSVNLQRSTVRGTEFSYDLSPRGGIGLGAFLAVANSTAKPSGVDNTGEATPAYNDHDQLWTVSGGTSYTHHSGATAGLTVYYGSGVESSKVPDPITGYEGTRKSHTEVDLRLASGPKLLRGIGADLTVGNVFDSRALINFNSGFSGTRFQQGRRVLVNLTGKF